MKKIMALSVLALASAANAQTIAQWNFNGPSATGVPGGATAPLPSIGIGTASLVGGTTATFASGTANGGSSDPVTTSPPNFGWNVTTFAAPGTQSGERGVQFNVSTVGFNDIIVSWDQRHSNTSSRFVQFQYSVDGSTFTNFGTPFQGTSGDTWFNGRTVDLSSISAVNNNPNFAFRIVAIFDPNGTDYVASSPTGTYASSGTWRFDMVTVVPTPGTMALLAMGGLVAARRRRA